MLWKWTAYVREHSCDWSTARATTPGRWICCVVLLFLSVCPDIGQCMTGRERSALKNQAVDLFYHGYDNYLQYAFPEDELRPLSCTSLSRDRKDPAHIEVNDVLGNYSLTLVDSLSTLAVLASTPASGGENKHLLAFQAGVKELVRLYGDGTDGPRGQGVRERGFNLDSKVQLFETVIRGLGGLLSAHLFAVGELPILGYHPAGEAVSYATRWNKGAAAGHSSGIRWDNGMVYDGQLLRLAYDLGNRLVPAFYTSTGIPYPRVNLREGIPFYERSPLNFDPETGQCDTDRQGTSEITETCSAGAGSLVLELTVLTRLTGDRRFEDLAKRAFWAIWNRRSAIGLIGTGIDAENGKWVGSYSGIGAGVDSFFEYALKSHILLSNDFHPQYRVSKHAKDPRALFAPLTAEENSPTSFLRVWHDAHGAIKRHLYRGKAYQHPHYIQGDLHTGASRAFWIDSLSSFFPGLLTLAGEVDEAIEIQLLATALWTRFSALPERWNIGSGTVEGGLGWWGGRPEFVESNYHLYRATGDPWYLHVGEMALHDIRRRCWTPCGWAGIQDVNTGQLKDRMESFFLSETAKYLFLLFDDRHPLNHVDSPFVFNTEGHPLIIPSSVGVSGPGRKLSRQRHAAHQDGSAETCPRTPASLPLGVSWTAARDDVFHAAVLARLDLSPKPNAPGSLTGDSTMSYASLSHSDVQSPSNHTYFPWTLPPELVSHNATSAPLRSRPSFDISFPSLPSLGSTTAPLKRVKEGILISHVGGLRLGMVRDAPLLHDGSGEGYRIHVVNNVALGKDEKVFLARDTTFGVLNPTDPNFTRVRDVGMLDLVVDLDITTNNSNATDTAAANEVSSRPQVPRSVKSTLVSIIGQVGALILNEQAPVFSFASRPGRGAHKSRLYIPAIAASGKGAAPIPDWKEAPSPTISGHAQGPLSWTRIYATDELCDHKISSSVAKTHQILLVKRGSCSFSEKLANIPAFIPDPMALQLVVVVSYEEPPPDADILKEDWLIQPLLDDEQRTSAGLLRRNPLPMVMVGGGQGAYEALRNAVGIAAKRRYTMEAQGIKITNLIIV